MFDELVGLALFSDNVSAEVKSAVVQRSLRNIAESKVRGNIFIKENKTTLGDFATARTTQLLHRFDIDSSFLQLPLVLWADNEGYIKGKERLMKLQVVNDAAERGVKLFQDYNLALSHDEEETQLILQVVEPNRKAVSSQTSKTSGVKALTISVETM